MFLFGLAYTHLADGKPIQAMIQHHPCPAERTIFVPVDPSMHIAVVVPDHKSPHSHPMPPMIKASFDAKSAYRQCIAANGVMASTAKKVDTGKLSTACCVIES